MTRYQPRHTQPIPAALTSHTAPSPAAPSLTVPSPAAPGLTAPSLRRVQVRNASLGLGAFAAAIGIALGLGTGRLDAMAQSDASTLGEVQAAAVIPAPDGADSEPGDELDTIVDPATVPTEAYVVGYVGALQPNGWYCGPAATRIALSAQGVLPTFDALAAALGTTRNGTKSIFEVTRVLNNTFNYEWYHSVELADRWVTDDQVAKLRSDTVGAVGDGFVVVANVLGTVTDTDGAVHSYPGGHYVTITGYAEHGDLVRVTDPADRVGSNEYRVSVAAMAQWIALRGYTAGGPTVSNQ